MHARYRGKAVRRAEAVRRAAAALATLPGVAPFQFVGVEDIRTTAHTPAAVVETVLALLASGEWAVGIGIVSEPEAPEPSPAMVDRAVSTATAALGSTHRAGTLKVKVVPRKQDSAEIAGDIVSAFLLITAVVAKRSEEGRQATSLMRRGYTQNEAAAELGISKQAMSQRLQAAGWQAEKHGIALATHLVQRAGRP